MIVQWRAVGATEFVSVWQGKTLSLVWMPGEHCWRLRVAAQEQDAVLMVKNREFPEGALVNQRWTSAGAAKDAIDATLSTLIARLGSVVVAVQRPTSQARVVRHGRRS
jgi:hypothetical protein